ncbi:response regulator [Salipiger sp. H15]|uniref:Response regulator n=1 Tax=Alloyangia sp. H15 TaxID=3029062 RepID=A0AAU8AIS8_9RHOB
MARILLADDDAGYLAAFCDGMAACGHEATGVTTGDQALTCLDSMAFDIVFLDVLMPGGGAISLTHAIRERHPALPIVVITGRPELASSPLLQKGLRYACAKIGKTATLEELDALVRHHARPGRREVSARS